jgi:hypothetical protein
MTFPLSVADFFNGLTISEMAFDLDEPITTSETEAGEILTASRGVSLWRGRLTLSPGRTVSGEAMRARIDLLRRSGATFWLEHPVMRFPQADREGRILRGFSPTVSALPANFRQVTIGGLPAHYSIRAGDHLSISFGTGGARRSYHRVVSGATVASGAAGPIEVNPPLPASVQVGNAVQLLRPALKAMIRPGSHSGAVLRPAGISGLESFDWVQTLG